MKAVFSTKFKYFVKKTAKELPKAAKELPKAAKEL